MSFFSVFLLIGRMILSSNILQSSFSLTFCEVLWRDFDSHDDRNASDIAKFTLVQKSLKKYFEDSFSESSEMPRKKVYAVAAGHRTGIFDSWPSCQKATKGFKGAKFKSFDNRKQTTSWLKENLESENLSALLQAYGNHISQFAFAV